MHRPAELPDSYRDFAIYTTSQPDSTDPALIEMTIQMVNRGKRPLATSVSLQPNQTLGFSDENISIVVPAGGKEMWRP